MASFEKRHSRIKLDRVELNFPEIGRTKQSPLSTPLMTVTESLWFYHLTISKVRAKLRMLGHWETWLRRTMRM